MPKSKECVEIRKAVLEDLPSVVAIEQACFTDDRFSDSQLAFLIVHSKGGVFLLEENGQSLGYLSVLYRRGCTNLRIYSISILPSAAGRGLGSLLMAFTLDEAIRLGLKRVTLEVHVDNAPALALYAKFGFHTEKLLPDYYGVGKDAFYMVRMLKEGDDGK